MEMLEDGPDCLHRFHRMLSGAYGVEIPVHEHRVVIAVLHNLGVSRRGIADLMRRFTHSFRSQIVIDISIAVQDKHLISEADYLRVEALFAPYGYESLARAQSKSWSHALTQRDPGEPCIPMALIKYWRVLVSEFPDGIRDVRDYVALLHVLRDEGFSSMEIEILMSELFDKPKDLVVRDIETLDTVLTISQDKKTMMRQRVPDLART